LPRSRALKDNVCPDCLLSPCSAPTRLVASGACVDRAIGGINMLTQQLPTVAGVATAPRPARAVSRSETNARDDLNRCCFGFLAECDGLSGSSLRAPARVRLCTIRSVSHHGPGFTAGQALRLAFLRVLHLRVVIVKAASGISGIPSLVSAAKYLFGQSKKCTA
jgi:hypothetical protein